MPLIADVAEGDRLKHEIDEQAYGQFDVGSCECRHQRRLSADGHCNPMSGTRRLRATYAALFWPCILKRGRCGDC